jgi:glycosyltransferase involved in cell wall biosynthesis
MKISIVIPVHNEEENICETIKNIENKLNLDYEIIIVNDHSRDDTGVIVKNLMKQYSNLMLVENDTGRGFADALRKGFSISNSDLIIPVMADSCDDPQTIAVMHDKVLDGFDVVCGSRYMKKGKKIGGPKLQSFFSRFVGLSLKHIIRIPTSDVSNSFKCYRRNVLEGIRTQSKGFELSMEITLKAYFAGYKITEVPTVWQGRYIGKSKFYLLRVAPSYIKLYLWAILKKNFKNG